MVSKGNAFGGGPGGKAPWSFSSHAPDLSRERALGGRVAGIDEVGRGPLAGPVLAAAVVLPADPPRILTMLLRDSKELSAPARERAAAALRCAEGVEIALGAASVVEIAARNILGASLLAMRRAVLRLPRLPDHALVDGNRAPDLPCPVVCVVGGDRRSLSIAAASIIAKVARDRLMARLAARFPAYGWAENAGYPTKTHRAALAAHGPCLHHRLSFAAVRALIAD